MLRWLTGLFFIAHGLIHLAIWLPSYRPGAGTPFNPGQSWLLRGIGLGEGPVRTVALALAVIAGIGFLLGGAGWLGAQGWGRTLAIWSAAVSLVLMVLYFHTWLLLGVVIDAATLILLLR